MKIQGWMKVYARELEAYENREHNEYSRFRHLYNQAPPKWLTLVVEQDKNNGYPGVEEFHVWF